MNVQNVLRYPGSIPFEKAQRAVFFGRDLDIKGLYRFINVNKLTVLHGKSGYGKTSLLNAGILPQLEEDGFLCIKIRFTGYKKEAHTTPKQLFFQKIREQLPDENSPIFLPEVENEEHNLSLWQQFKQLEWQHRQQKGIILIFDQFEEIFSYPEGVEEFANEFADLFNNRMPAFFQQKLYQKISEDPQLLEKNADEIEFIEHHLLLRVVFSLRSDRLSFLNRLAPWLPHILKNCYELLPLSAEQAAEAIESPARAVGPFASPAFEYQPAALTRILDYLTDENTKPVESFQLQILCRHLEKQLLAGQLTPPIDADELGDIASVYQNYYDSIIQSLPADQQLLVQKFVEDGLIFEDDERRLSLYEGQIIKHWKIPAETLAALVNLHLLRAEPSSAGGFMYELCHDSMVAPILRVKLARTADERRRAADLERQQREAEQARLRAETDLARRRQRRATAIAIAAVLLAAIAIGASALAVLKSREAQRQSDLAGKSEQKALAEKENAQTQQKLAEAQTRRADEQKTLAEKNAAAAAAATQKANENLTQARLNLEKAEAEKRRADQALENLKLEKNVSEKRRTDAENNAALAQKETDRANRALDSLNVAAEKILANLLNEAETHLQFLDENQAFGKLIAAASLQRNTPRLTQLLMEIAFFFEETNQFEPAEQARRAIQKLNPQTEIELPPRNSSAWKTTLQKFNISEMNRLTDRYFSKMVSVRGGSFRMGCDSLSNCVSADEKPLHRVTVSDFSIGQTEVTARQFHLFCVATGLNPQPFLSDGEWPVVKVSWLDAARFANWMSEKMGLEKTYIFTTDGKNVQQIRTTLKNTFRLPTEAEWEFSARAAGSEQFRFSGSNQIEEVAWYLGNSSKNQNPSPVGQKKPNGLQLFDLSGNVREWCNDGFAAYSAASVADPFGSDFNPLKIVRGGSFKAQLTYCGLTFRQSVPFTNTETDIGFRLVRR